MNAWVVMTGKLDKGTVTQAQAIAVRHNNGSTEIKETSKDILWKYNLSPLYTHYRVIL